jgi:hypothetical protein
MTPTPEYAVSVAFRDGYYFPVVHLWERNATTEKPFRLGASSARMIAQAKAMELANRLQVPFCQTSTAISDSLARYIVKRSAGHAAANNLKTELLSRVCVAKVAARYGLQEETVRSIRDMLATVRDAVR